MATELYDKAEVQAIQRKGLEILSYFREFCEKYHINFYVGSGCCIGAVRHKGFIPWDDDIDVFLLRSDYERVAILWNQYADTSRYAYCRTTEKENYHDTGASIRDNRTTFINKHCVDADINQGLQIDLIPIDKCAKGKIPHARQIFWAVVFSLFNAQRLPDNQGSVARYVTRLVYALVPSKRLKDKIWRYAEKRMLVKDDSLYDGYTELVTGLKGLTLHYPESFFGSPVYLQFEDTTIPVYSHYKDYLSMVFGNYMALPPAEERVPKHNTVFVDMNHPYTDYKGKYYCIENSK